MELQKEMKEMELHGENLENFGIIAEEGIKGEEEIWFETASQPFENNNNDNNNLINLNNNINNNNINNNEDDFLDVDVSDPSSLFYADFPPLPDFPCMSSSSSSSSSPAVKALFGLSSAATTSSSVSTASSGAASWADANQDPEQGPGPVMDGERVEEEIALDDVDQCMDMMQNFGGIDNMLDSSDICWDPSPLFEDDNNNNGGGGDERDSGGYQFFRAEEFMENHGVDKDEEDRVFEQFMQHHQQKGESSNITSNNNDPTSGIVDIGGVGVNDEPGSSSDDLAMVFFEWLKSNKEAISAEDLRNIKIKKTTIENAAKRLGGGKEGMKQLLKLILQWVQNHHLQNKKIMMMGGGSGCEDNNEFHNNNNNNNQSYSIQDHKNNDSITMGTTSDNSGGNPSCLPDSSQCLSPTTWIPIPTPPPPQSYVNEPPVMVPMTAPPHPPAVPGFPATVGYMGGDPYGGGNPMAAYPSMPLSDCHTWVPTPMQYGMGPYGGYPDGSQFGGYGTPPPYPGFYYHPGPTDGLVRLGSSATKEARKKRMARQRRFFTHHHRNSHHNNANHHHHQQLQNNSNGNDVNQQLMMSQIAEQQHAAAVVGNGNCGVVAPHGNWVYWPPPQPPQVVGVGPPQVNHPGPMAGQMLPPQPPPMERAAANGYQKHVGIEKKQGWKTEKNLRFLLQKVLKQSDVGNLGRIVLPKKEAETHLPELEARDGIPIAMEDIGTSRVWNMRYRFWPNNKSRMYLLENTGDFVRSNGLQEGDFIVIYSDVKCGKYMIRGVKVRPQQQSAKPELTNKKSNKAQKNEPTPSLAGIGSASSPTVVQS